jgi:hypothetical protein
MTALAITLPTGVPGGGETGLPTQRFGILEWKK